MKVIRPVIVTGAVLAASSVAEDDHPEWAVGTTYALGDRVIKAATHRVYESVIADNLDHDPQSELEAAWLDAGPTNRWAMFDSAGGPRTIDDAQISVELVPTAPVTSLGMLDVSAAQVRVQVIAGGATVFDQIEAAPASNLAWLDLPAVAGQRVVVTATPAAGGHASIGKLVIGDAFDVGETQDGPAASIIDFSRRETDDFGVTSVVERAWARRIAVGSRLSSDDVDAVQRYLASIRAVPVMWIGEPGFEALTVFGYFKEFSVDLQIGTTSNCSLTIEGLPSAQVPVVMPDPAVEGVSDLLVIPPVTLTSAMLAASSVPENDAPVWQAASTYQAGDKVIWAETHRVYESLVPGNTARLPSDVAAWLDLGPTNRWAMFDQALGTATEQATSIEVTIAAVSRVQGLAVLDTNAASVRVRAGAYDQNLAVEGQGGMAVFLDLDVAPGGPITVTIAAQAVGQLVSVGTLLFGPLVPLGVTENTPTIGITDFSVKTTDDFGNTNAVERAWAKHMDVRSLVRTDAVDPLTRTMATLRAKPALWIGHGAFESLSVYGFFKDFSSTLSERTSACSFTIEGLSKADKVVPVDDAIVLVTIYRNAAVKPAAPAFDTGQVPAGWAAAPQDLGEGEYRWAVQAEFRGSAQRTQWSAPVAVAGVSWADVIDDDPENPKPESGATVGATPDEKDKLAELDAAGDQFALDLAAAQSTIATIQSDAAATQLELEQAQADIAAQADLILANGENIETIETALGSYDARITTAQTTADNAAGQLASLSTTVSTQGAEISQNASAITAVQGSLATLTTRVDAAGGYNLLSNGGFEDGFTGWNSDGLWALSSDWGWGRYAVRTNFTGNVILAKVVAVNPGVTLTLSGDMSINGDGHGYFDMIFRNSAGGELLDSDQTIKTAGDFDPTGVSRQTYKCTATAPAGTTEVVVRFVAYSANTSFLAGVRQMKLERGTVATAYSSDASIVQTFSALSTIDGQYASLSTTVSTQGAEISQNAAAITEINGQYASLSSTVSTQQSSIAQNASAISGLQGNLATLTTRVTAGNANLVPNGGFENGLSGWAGSGFTYAVNGWGAQVYTSSDGTKSLESTKFPVFGTAIYTIAADLAFFASSGSVYIDMIFFNDAGNVVFDGPQIARTPTFDFTADGSGRIASAVTTTAPASATQALARFVVQDGVGVTFAGVRQIKVEQSSVATAYSSEASILQTFSALSTVNQQYADLSSTVSTQGVTISSQQTAITTINGDVATLFGRASVKVDVNGVVTGWETNNNGQTGNFIVSADSFEIRPSSTSGPRTQYADGTWRVYAGSVMTVWGIGFGSSGQFIEWTGPAQSSLSGCTEGNAIKYVKTNGQAYFGGGLSSGVLKNEGTSTTVSPTASITVGTFSSNGHTINVNVSANYRRYNTAQAGTGSISGSGSGVVTIEGSTNGGASWVSLGTMGVNENMRTVLVDGDPSVPDQITWQMQGATTVTWTPGASNNLQIRARWSSFAAPSFGGTNQSAASYTQTTSVIAVEQP